MRKTFFLFILILSLPLLNIHGRGQNDGQQNQDYSTSWNRIANNVDDAFFNVVDKIISLQEFFLQQALSIGRVVFLIALLTAALNYVLTGQGLKENIIKLSKATLFFFIIIAAYPRIIGAITSWTFGIAQESIYPAVRSYFQDTVETVLDEVEHRIVVGQRTVGGNFASTNTYQSVTFTEDVYHTFTGSVARNVYSNDRQGLFTDLAVERTAFGLTYTTVSPSAVFKVIFFIAGDCFKFANTKESNSIFPEVSRILIGLICGFFVIFTGIFALIEYLVCFLEFMLVATVGVILFPLSLWEGTKPWAEKYIGAIVGFFIKLLFCNIAIFFLIYGFVSLFYIIQGEGFSGNMDQIVFIIFSCLLFFLICKSAPSMAQSLLTGTPNLSASGAISAVGGAVAAAGATLGYAKQAGLIGANTAGAAAGGLTRGVTGMIGSLKEAGAASNAVRDFGGTKSQADGAFASSLFQDAWSSTKAGALGLTRNLMGDKSSGTNPHSWHQEFMNKRDDGHVQTYKDHFNERKDEGARRGKEFAKKRGLNVPNENPPANNNSASNNNT